MSDISFGRTPQETIEYFEKKGLKVTWDYDEMLYEAHHKAFTVAKVTKLDLLKDIQSSLLEAMKSGQNYEDWHKNIKPTLQKHGWYGKTEVFNPETGEFKTITVGSRRLKNIFDTNMRVSYARTSYKQQMSFTMAVFWRYNSMLLETTRDSHRAGHGIVKHRDDIWWNTNYPPNDWNCKCFITAHTAKELAKKGWSVHTGILDNIASKDWAYNVGKDDNIANVWKDKINKLSMPKKDDTKIIKLSKEKMKKMAIEEKELSDLFIESMGKASPALQAYLILKTPIMKYDKKDKTPSYYNSKTKEIVITNIKDENLIQTLRHEVGHHVDNQNDWFSSSLIKTLSFEQIALLQNKTKEEVLDMLRKEDNIPLHDMFYINSRDKASLWQTRLDDFDLTDKDTIAKETFANIFEMILTSDDRLDIIRKYFPMTVEQIEKFLKDL